MTKEGGVGPILGIWEVPTPGTMRQVNNARTELNSAMAQARAIVEKARAMSRALAPHGVTMTVTN